MLQNLTANVNIYIQSRIYTLLFDVYKNERHKDWATNFSDVYGAEFLAFMLVLYMQCLAHVYA